MTCFKPAFSFFFYAVVATTIHKGQAQDCASTWRCQPTETPPTLDADLSEWDNVEGISTSLVMALSGTEYDGQAVYKCLYDSTNIYFALEIPGLFRFSSSDNHQCAAIATMMKIGADATFVNMGGCPDALGGCDGGVPTTCDAHRVDIGAHWELSGTEQGVLYPINVVSDVGEPSVTRSGDDLVANKDDEYAVSPYCRFDDDDENAGNEWAGAWAHTNPVDAAVGTYKFELSRLLKTKSTLTDAQMTPGETYSFGVAYWDPNEMESGWSDPGHYVSGCGTNWIDLELAEDDIKVQSTTSGAGTDRSFFVMVITMISGAIFALQL